MHKAVKLTNQFPFYHQLDHQDCGATCLRMIAKYYSRNYSIQYLREKSYITREGVSLLGISEAAEAIGMRSLAIRLPFAKLKEVVLPCIVHWRQNHFVVVYKIKKGKIYVADPASGLITFRHDEFLRGWSSFNHNKDNTEGVILVLEPAPEFYQSNGEPTSNKAIWSFLWGYLIQYKAYILQLVLGLLLGTILSLIFPFLTQSIVDFGIKNQDLSFVVTILIAQVMLFAGRTAVEFIRGWILLHLSVRINIAIISDFLIKLMKLPISFFDSKTIGDLLQRISDHDRIQSFLSITTLNVLFSSINLFVYGMVLLYYNSTIFLVFLTGSTLTIAWIVLFMKKRRELDHKQFSELADEQGILIQLIRGMPEIKLNSVERQKRWEWEHVQARLFNTKIKGLILSQYQDGGSATLKEFTNILITFLAAKAVIEAQMTLGMMLAVQYIVGQLNAPINQFVLFSRMLQDAKISLERLGEIHNTENEENPDEPKTTYIQTDEALYIRNLSFQYEGPRSPLILDNLSMDIPKGKVTAIVGVSGSGKTTLFKLLLKFYKPTMGEIKLGDLNLYAVDTAVWRSHTGAVMQDGFIFNDTIARNICLDFESIDYERLLDAVRIANIQEFIESLPLGYNTKIGTEGQGISAGQKQRILIARAAYKNPAYLFFDEATSALDAYNERVILENLDTFFKGKTVIIIAHRLSTVKNADQIIVLDKGSVQESGTHSELTALRGAYYQLVKNQLELGS